MIYLSAASYPEAAPFIRYFKLKKNMESRFETFSAPQAALIVTGRGAMEAAAAVSFLLTRAGAGSENSKSVFTHIRVLKTAAGAPAALCDKLRSPDGRDFYPDILFAHPFAQAEEDSPEAAGAFRAALFFLPPHRIFIFQLQKNAEKSERTVSSVIDWLDSLPDLLPEPPEIFTGPEKALLEQTSQHLHLTHTSNLGFLRFMRFRKLRGDDLAALLEESLAAPCSGVQEGKILFAKLREKLLDF